MTHSNNFADIEAVYQLLTSYSFDAESYQTKAIAAGWLAEFGPVWVSHAITEALYQGRYKLISIDQILKLWQRRGQPIRHFNREFESIILGQTLIYPIGYGVGPEPSTQGRVAPSASPEITPHSAPPSPELELPHPESDQTEPDQADLIREAPAASTAQRNPFDQTSAVDVTSGLKAVEEPAVSEVSAAAEEPTIEEPTIHAAFESRVDTSSEFTGKTHPEVPDFRPVEPEGSSLGHQVEVIQPFVPRRDESELHERLRAVVQGGMQE
jgi:hypothetical protein